jgi:nucleotide-binding universal stress UspA family protein
MSSPSIVCAVDQSHAAGRALTVADQLGRRLGSRLVVAHALRAVPVGVSHGMPGVAHGASYAAEKDAARQFLNELAQRHDLVAPRLRVELGVPNDVIARVVREENAQFVVTGSRGRRRLPAAVLGSFSAGLVAEASCPVVVVPPHAAPRDGSGESRAVVCGLDDSDRAGKVLRCADTLASLLEADLVVAHIAPIPHWPGTAAVPRATEELRRVEADDVDDFLAALLDANPTASPTRRKVAFGDPGGALADMAEEEAAAFVVVGSRGRRPLTSAVLGSVTAELVGSSRTPVVVVPPGVDLHRQT